MTNPYDRDPYGHEPASVRSRESNPYDTAAERSVFGPSIQMRGSLSAAENIFLFGRFEGNLLNTEWLRIGRRGKVKADVRAKHITVEGAAQGRLIGTQTVIVRDSATVNANIYAPSVKLHEKATFNGSIDMEFMKRRNEKTATAQVENQAQALKEAQQRLVAQAQARVQQRTLSKTRNAG